MMNSEVISLLICVIATLAALLTGHMGFAVAFFILSFLSLE